MAIAKGETVRTCMQCDTAKTRVYIFEPNTLYRADNSTKQLVEFG